MIQKYGYEVVSTARHIEHEILLKEHNVSHNVSQVLFHMAQVEIKLKYVESLLGDADIDTQKVIGFITEYESWR